MKKETEDLLFAAQEQGLRPIQSKQRYTHNQFLPNVDSVGQNRRPLCIYLVVAPSWRRNSTKEDVTMLPEGFI